MPERPGRYDRDVLDAWDEQRAAARRPAPEVEATPGLVVTHRASGAVGAVRLAEQGAVELVLDDRSVRLFRLDPSAFLLHGKPVTLVPPRRLVRAKPTSSTASGSIAVQHDARVARGSRLLVEGVHDAELVEQVWGDDLRYVGVVVERLDGIDHLAEWVEAFRPAPGHRLGVLVDHLVAGSKETRIAASVRHPHVLVTGTPFVDVWEAISPRALGIERWPAVPKGEDWKTGVCARLGWGEPTDVWRRLKASVRSYADLDPALVGAVERLIDFVTDEGGE